MQLEDQTLGRFGEVKEQVKVHRLFGIAGHLSLQAVETIRRGARFEVKFDFGQWQAVEWRLRSKRLNDRAERGARVIEGGHHLVPRMLQMLCYGCVLGNLGLNRQELNAVANHLGIGELLLRRIRNAKHDVARGAELAEEHLRRCISAHEQRTALFTAGFFQRL